MEARSNNRRLSRSNTNSSNTSLTDISYENTTNSNMNSFFNSNLNSVTKSSNNSFNDSYSSFNMSSDNCIIGNSITSFANDILIDSNSSSNFSSIKLGNNKYNVSFNDSNKSSTKDFQQEGQSCNITNSRLFEGLGEKKINKVKTSNENKILASFQIFFLLFFTENHPS